MSTSFAQLRPFARPLIISIDDREKLPYNFESVFNPPSFDIVREHLQTGDYSLRVSPATPKSDRIVIERKSLADLYGTLGQHRERFESEFIRLAEYGYPALVIEATLEQIMAPNLYLPHPTQMRPRSVVMTLVSWSQRHGVHVWMMPGRRAAEQMTFRMLEHWAKDHHCVPLERRKP